MEVGKLEAAEATLEATDLDEVVAILEVLALRDEVLAVLDDIPESMRCIVHKKIVNEYLYRI